MATRVGFIGIGNMGLAMALRLRELGREVRVCDIDPARVDVASAHGAQSSPTPAALASGCEVVIVAVVDAAQVETVLFGVDGAAAALAGGACVMLCPTIEPACTEQVAQRLATLGIDCIDAPMSGGPARARDGSMSLMVACAGAVFERHRDLIESLSRHVFRIGERPGDGARAKLVNNLIAATNLAGAAEGLALVRRVGLDADRLLDVIERSSGQSWIGSDRMRRALAGDAAVRAHTRLLAKDSRLAIAMAERVGFEPALGRQAAALFAEACAQGLADADDASLLGHLEAAASASAPAPMSAAAHGVAAEAERVHPMPMPRRRAGPNGILTPSTAASDPAPSAGTVLDPATASRYAACALQSLEQHYPHALQHLMRDATDHGVPEALHPIFHGSYDWHSSVHMQWSLVRLLRIAPTLPDRAVILARFERLYTRERAERERAYLLAHPGFERPYGWAWLLLLHAELEALAVAHADARRWAAVLRPLVEEVRQRWLDHLALAPSPQRVGAHPNSAFAMRLALAHADAFEDATLTAAIGAAARRWFGDDTAYPASYEPSATDFLSGGLCEAVLMDAVLTSNADFERWWDAFRPSDQGLARWLEPAPVVSRRDAQLVHADGLNLSRAWCLAVLARRLPAERVRFEAARERHLAAALPHVTHGDFVATHWLVSFALLATTGLSLRAGTGTG